MSKKNILAVFCFFLLFLGVLWEWNIYNRIYGITQRVTTEKVVTEKIAYLTFDDGPSVLTRRILEILEKENIKATFFLIGSQITKEEEQLLKA